MSDDSGAGLADFPRLLGEIKTRIQQAQARAIMAASGELVRLYCDIGRLIDARQKLEGWRAGVSRAPEVTPRPTATIKKTPRKKPRN